MREEREGEETVVLFRKRERERFNGYKAEGETVEDGERVSTKREHSWTLETDEQDGEKAKIMKGLRNKEGKRKDTKRKMTYDSCRERGPCSVAAPSWCCWPDRSALR